MEVNRDRIPLSFEAFLMVAAFIFSYAVVDVFYDNVAMPQYEVFLAEKEAEKQERESQQPDGGAQAAKADEDSKTSVWEVLNGFEQKITITLFLASLILLLYKFVLVIRDRGLLKIDFLDLPPGRFIDRGDALDYVHEIDSELPADLPKPFSKTVTPFRQSLVPRALRRALHRFNEDDSVGKEEISHTITAECEGELMKLESQLVTINYIAWAIPSVGFIGTVRGIGMALAEADSALYDNNISPVTSALGLAFNSTLVALFVSMFLMLLIYALKRMQEAFVLDAESFAQGRLLTRI